MTAQIIYPWKRFWCLRDGSLSLDSSGFLYYSEFSKDVVVFDSLENKTCLMLLGEPGIGKSQAVLDAVRNAANNFPKDEHLFIDLRSYGSEERLHKAIFSNEIINRWINSNQNLHLYLDSLDECLLRVDTVAAMLVEEFGKKDFPIRRLFLRIACRTSVLPKLLEDGLKEICRNNGLDQGFGVYELCPLRLIDVQIASKLQGVNASVFIDAVVERNVGMLAARPVTLDLLFNLYKNHSRLPANISDLYEQGCRVLCDEPNDSRRDSTHLKPTLSAVQTLSIAGRIAVYTILCNKAAIWKGFETGAQRTEDITVRELAGDVEEVAGIDFSVTENEIRTALNTGLFTARDANRQGWAHQSFAEFLAAWYLTHRRISLDQIISIITSKVDSEGKPVQQIAEMLSWLANMREDVREYLLGVDPTMLMRSDLASFSVDFRRSLAQKILNLFAEEKELNDSGFRNHFNRLNHPQLKDQLLPYITGKEYGVPVRRLAIDIAEACDLRELEEILTDIVLDETDAFYVRVNAGYAVWKIASLETRKRLKTLALDGSPNDEHEELRGVALLSTWSDAIKAEELFNTFAYPPQSFFGAYSLFLSSLASKIKVHDIPSALRWAREKDEEFGNDFSVKRVMDEIILLGWQNIDYPEVLEEFAQIASFRLQKYSFNEIVDLHKSKFEIELTGEPDKFQDLLTNKDKRNKVLKRIALYFSDRPRSYHNIFRSKVFQPAISDLPWLFEALTNAQSEKEQWFFFRIIGEFYGVHNFQPEIINLYHAQEVEPENFSLLSDYYYKSEIVKKYFSLVFEPIIIGSNEASHLKDIYEHHREQQREIVEMNEPPPLLTPSPQERINNRLAEIEAGQTAFWALSQELSLEERSQSYLSWAAFDITKFPGWIAASDEVRERIIRAAQNFVLNGNPENDDWMGTNNYRYAALAGFRALFLLCTSSPEFVQNLTNLIWEKWSPIILLHPGNFNDEDEIKYRQQLLNRAYQSAPEQIINTLSLHISAINADETRYFSFPRNIELFWDGALKDSLRKSLISGNLKLSLWRTILDKLIEHGDQKTEKIAELAIISYSNGSIVSDKFALAAAASLIKGSQTSEWWKIIWEIIQKNTDFGRKIVEYACHNSLPFGRLAEMEAADFYLWLVTQYPYEEDEPFPTGHFGGVSTRMQIGQWRDSIISNLRDRGTPESVIELERIARELNEPTRFKWNILEARKNVRKHNWSALKPLELREILKQNAEQVLDNDRSGVAKTLNDDEIGNLEFAGKLVRNVPHLANFLKLYRDKAENIIFFTGAGLSTPLFPSWTGALEELVDLREIQRGNPAKTAELRQMLSLGQYLEVADICAQDLNKSLYRDFIQRTFDKNFEKKDIPKAYADLLNLRPRTILTTNYDRIPDVGGNGLYRTYANIDSATAESKVMNNEDVVFKLHGSVTQPDTIVFTSLEYQENYQRHSLKGFLDAVIRLRPLIFLGFGLTDPYFNSLLENIFASNQQLLQGKYALLEGLSQTQIDAKEKRYGLKIIPYQKSGNDHPEVKTFIKLLAVTRG